MYFAFPMALKPEPIEIDVKFQRASADEQILDVMFSFKNTSNAPVTIATNYVCIGFLDYRADRDDENPNEGSPSIIEDTGYTVRQLLYGGTPSSPYDGFCGMQFQNYLDGLRHEIRSPPGSPGSLRNDPSAGNRFLLLPGESVPYLWRTSVSKPGRWELAVRYAHYVPETRSYIPIQAWKTIDVPLLSERSYSKPLTIRARVTTELAAFHCGGDWQKTHWIEGRLINDTGSLRHIFAVPSAAGVCLPGEILLYGENGERVNGLVEWPVPDRNCTQQSIGPEGIPFCFRVWQDAIMPRPPRIDRIEFWTITDAGLEKMTVAKDIPFVEFPDPEWGPADQGTRCRIRLVKNHFSAGDEISFGFEVESDQKVCEVLHPHFDLSFDGKLVPWIDANDWTFPFRMGLSLRDLSKRDEVQLTPGRHKLQVTVRGNPGNMADAYGRKRRHFEGTMVSNELEIEIVEAGEH